jgi:hypothetical protein
MRCALAKTYRVTLTASWRVGPVLGSQVAVIEEPVRPAVAKQWKKRYGEQVIRTLRVTYPPRADQGNYTAASAVHTSPLAEGKSDMIVVDTGQSEAARIRGDRFETVETSLGAGKALLVYRDDRCVGEFPPGRWFGVYVEETSSTALAKDLSTLAWVDAPPAS